MVDIRMDPRLKARIDSGDVVQEALLEAFRRIDEYLVDRPIPFYPWLRQIAMNRLIDLYRKHIRADGRSVDRERAAGGDSSVSVQHHFGAGDDTSPSEHLARTERIQFVEAVLTQLTEADRELIVMRHMEQLSTRDVAAILKISEGAVKTRLVRALERFRAVVAGRDESHP